MKVVIKWENEGEASVTCKAWRKPPARFLFYETGETQGEITSKQENVILKMTKIILNVDKKLRKLGYTEVTYYAEQGSRFQKILDSTDVVSYERSEYMLVKTASNATDSEEKKKSENQEELPKESKKEDQEESMERILITETENGYYCKTEGNPVFSAKLDRYSDGWYLYEVEVEEPHRNKGIGTKALKLLLEQIGELPNQKSQSSLDREEATQQEHSKEEYVPQKIYLQVSSKNQRALHVYRKLGFQTKTELCYYL